MNIFYGGTLLNKEELESAGITHPIKLEYYKIVNEYNENKNKKYGIKVVKTEYLKDNMKIENKEIKDLTNSENRTNKILEILKENKVTPISVQDIICDFSKIIRYCNL